MKSLCPRLGASFLPMILAAVAVLPSFAQALPKVEGAWIRASVPGQQGTGGFMRLTAPQNMQLVGVATPVAGTAEVHEMKMEGDVMRMRALSSLPLAPGKTIELKPGGLHLMLMDLKAPLVTGTRIPVTLLLRDAKGAEQRVAVELPVSASATGSGAGTPSHGAHHRH
jgi:copper(I)-binding protein